MIEIIKESNPEVSDQRIIKLLNADIHLQTPRKRRVY